MHIGSVVIDCNDFATMSAFWAEALHYEPREPAEEDWVVLRDPRGVNVNVSLQQVPERASEKNRLHFDLYTTDPEESRSVARDRRHAPSEGARAGRGLHRPRRSGGQSLLRGRRASVVTFGHNGPSTMSQVRATFDLAVVVSA